MLADTPIGLTILADAPAEIQNELRDLINQNTGTHKTITLKENMEKKDLYNFLVLIHHLHFFQQCTQLTVDMRVKQLYDSRVRELLIQFNQKGIDVDVQGPPVPKLIPFAFLLIFLLDGILACVGPATFPWIGFLSVGFSLRKFFVDRSYFYDKSMTFLMWPFLAGLIAATTLIMLHMAGISIGFLASYTIGDDIITLFSFGLASILFTLMLFNCFVPPWEKNQGLRYTRL